MLPFTDTIPVYIFNINNRVSNFMDTSSGVKYYLKFSMDVQPEFIRFSVSGQFHSERIENKSSF